MRILRGRSDTQKHALRVGATLCRDPDKPSRRKAAPTVSRNSIRQILLALVALLASAVASAKTILRVGYFPNVTHAQGVIGSYATAQGRGWFEQRLGPDVAVQWFAYNAGPSAMEAIFAGSIDLTYVGPSPALNAHIRSRGDEIRVLAGAAEGGAALVVRKEGGPQVPAEFRGLKIGTPQPGNTQDVAARTWLRQHGFRVSPTGGDVQVIPTANADQLALFTAGRLEAVWTVEPWVSRLELEGGGRIYLEQRQAVTTLLVARAKWLRENPVVAKKFVAAHQELTEWMGAHGAEARAQVRAGLTAAIRREVSAELIKAAWARLRFTSEVRRDQLEGLVADAQNVGFLRNAIPLDHLLWSAP